MLPSQPPQNTTNNNNDLMYALLQQMASQTTNLVVKFSDLEESVGETDKRVSKMENSLINLERSVSYQSDILNKLNSVVFEGKNGSQSQVGAIERLKWELDESKKKIATLETQDQQRAAETKATNWKIIGLILSILASIAVNVVTFFILGSK